jgi:hypothetical protein
MPLEAAARSLAHLVLGGMSMAELSAQKLASACANQRCSQYTTRYFRKGFFIQFELTTQDAEMCCPHKAHQLLTAFLTITR